MIVNRIILTRIYATCDAQVMATRELQLRAEADLYESGHRAWRAIESLGHTTGRNGDTLTVRYQWQVGTKDVK